MAKRLIAIILAASLLLACGCSEAPAEGGGEVTIPANLIVEIDGPSMAAPETAAVITANRIIFEPDAAEEALVVYDATETFEGDGSIWRAYADGKFEYLGVFYDGYGTEDRLPTGGLRYRRVAEDLSTELNVPMKLQEHIGAASGAFRKWSALGYLGDADLDDLTAAEARERAETAFAGLGIPAEGLENTGTYRLGVEEQVAYLDSCGDAAELNGLSAEQEALMSSAYVLEYRQVFDGIPVNTTNWYRGIDGTAQGLSAMQAVMQTLTAAVWADDSFSVGVQNVLEPTERGESRDVISYDEAFARLVEMFSQTILPEKQYLIAAELCYAVYETDVRDSVVLYPLWVFSVLNQGDFVDIDLSEYISGESEDLFVATLGADKYAFDAFTGERIASIELPESAN